MKESRVGWVWSRGVVGRCGGVVCDVGWLIVAGSGRRIFTRRWRVVVSVVVGAGLAGFVRRRGQGGEFGSTMERIYWIEKVVAVWGRR